MAINFDFLTNPENQKGMFFKAQVNESGLVKVLDFNLPGSNFNDALVLADRRARDKAHKDTYFPFLELTCSDESLTNLTMYFESFCRIDSDDCGSVIQLSSSISKEGKTAVSLRAFHRNDDANMDDDEELAEGAKAFWQKSVLYFETNDS